MKNLLLLVCLSLATMCTQGQSKPSTVGSMVDTAIAVTKSAASKAVTAVKTVANEVDTSRLSKQIYGDAKKALISLAAGLKVGAEHVYKVLVKQSVVTAITWLIMGIIAVIILTYFTRNLTNKEEKWTAVDKDDGLSYPTFTGVIRVLQGILGTILSIIVLTHLQEIVMGFVNPEYGALSKIMDMIKGM